jgi:2'-5' RNA ligase
VVSRCPEPTVPASQPPQEFRLFIALAIPDAVKETIEATQAELRRLLPPKAARWTRREQFHLTLRFLGNVAASRVEELVEACRSACQSFSPLYLCAGRIGFFPKAREPRVVWVGISDLDDRLAAMWNAVQSATQPFTSEPPESGFTGHVTLARVNRLTRDQAGHLAASAAKFEQTVFGEWTTGQLELMRSELLPEGARHSVLALFPLLGERGEIAGSE